MIYLFSLTGVFLHPFSLNPCQLCHHQHFPEMTSAFLGSRQPLSPHPADIGLDSSHPSQVLSSWHCPPLVLLLLHGSLLFSVCSPLFKMREVDWKQTENLNTSRKSSRSKQGGNMGAGTAQSRRCFYVAVKAVLLYFLNVYNKHSQHSLCAVTLYSCRCPGNKESI